MRRPYSAGIVALRPERGRADPRLQRHRRHPGEARRLDHRRPLPDPGTPHPAGRGRLHGQRLRADAPPRLRHRCAACSMTRATRSTCMPADNDDDVPAWSAALHDHRRFDAALARHRRPGRHHHRRLGGARGRGRRARRVLEGRGRNLRLFHRMLDVIAKDDDFSLRAIELRDRLDELHAFYGLRVRAAMEAVYAVQRRSSRHGVRDARSSRAIEAVRAVDSWYTAAVASAYREFDAASPTSRRSEVIGWHRGELAAAIGRLWGDGDHRRPRRDPAARLRLFGLQIPTTCP